MAGCIKNFNIHSWAVCLRHPPVPMTEDGNAQSCLPPSLANVNVLPTALAWQQENRLQVGKKIVDFPKWNQSGIVPFWRGKQDPSSSTDEKRSALIGKKRRSLWKQGPLSFAGSPFFGVTRVLSCCDALRDRGLSGG
jgi:hypothetical protein